MVFRLVWNSLKTAQISDNKNKGQVSNNAEYAELILKVPYLI